MAYEIVIQFAAEYDVDDTIQWYEEQETGLGKRFSLQFWDGVKKIKANPTYFSFWLDDFRRINIKSFPYNIIYKIIDQIVLIVAVLHHSRNPAELLKRKS